MLTFRAFALRTSSVGAWTTDLLPYGGITYLINSFDYPNLLGKNNATGAVPTFGAIILSRNDNLLFLEKLQFKCNELSKKLLFKRKMATAPTSTVAKVGCLQGVYKSLKIHYLLISIFKIHKFDYLIFNFHYLWCRTFRRFSIRHLCLSLPVLPCVLLIACDKHVFGDEAVKHELLRGDCARCSNRANI